MSKKSGSRVQRYMLAGVLTIIPLWITWVVLSFLFKLLSSLGDPWARAVAASVARTSPGLSEILVHPWLQPILATILILIGLYVLGWVSTRVVGRQLVNAFENLIDRIPLVQKIYGSARKIIATLNQDNKKMDRVVLIEFPNKSMKTVGFVTKILHEKNSGQELAAVYVPTTPNPTSGYLEIIPTDSLINTDLTVEEAMTFIVSGGTVGPDKILFDKATG
jgi:uncharacterized membrane protein